ncbi:hypothetical protein [Yoonia sp.]|uniref:hypothetical protein n=1 Tax=Yoonia sp. TaxID=2212373 RepID=UPI003F6C09FC
MRWRIGWFLAATFALVGCGGGDGGGSGINPQLSRLDIYEAQKLRVLGDTGTGVMGVAVTDAGAMPPTGTADFAGFATLRVEAETPLVLFGDAQVNVGFDAGLASGQIDAVFGTDRSGRVVDYTGAIVLDAGVVGGDVPSDLQLDYGGVLTAAGETLILDGAVTGDFRGTPVAAISLSALEAVVAHNGLPTHATLVVVAEVTP